MKKIFYKTMWGVIFVVGWAGVPTLSILLVTPLIAPLLPATVAVLVPAVISGLCAGIMVKGLSMAAKWYKKNYMNSELNQSKINNQLIPSKYQIKKTIVIAKLISIVQPFYKYIVKSPTKKLHKNIVLNSEIKNPNQKIEQLPEQITTFSTAPIHVVTSTQIHVVSASHMQSLTSERKPALSLEQIITINEHQKVEDFSLIVKQEIAMIDDKIQKIMPLSKLILSN